MKKIKLLFVILSLSVSLLLPIFAYKKSVYAAQGKSGENGIQSSATLRWGDRAHIYLDSISLIDSDSGKLQFSQSDEASFVRESRGEGFLNELINNLVAKSNTYYDESIYDAENIYEYKHSCDDTMTIDVPDIDGTNEGVLYLDRLQIDIPETNLVDAPSGCHYVLEPNLNNGSSSGRNGVVSLIVEMKDTENKKIWFKFNGDDELVSVDGKEKFSRFKPPEVNATDEEKRDYNPNTYWTNKYATADEQRKCDDGKGPRIILNESDRKDTSKTRVWGSYETCDDNKPAFAMISIRDDGKTGSSDEAKNEAGGLKGIPGEDSDPNAPEATCESANPGVFDWAMCGIIGFVDDMLVGQDGSGGLLGQVDGLLNVSKDEYDNTQLKIVWSYFRNIASFALVIIGLIMVIGQAVSKE